MASAIYSSKTDEINIKNKSNPKKRPALGSWSSANSYSSSDQKTKQLTISSEFYTGQDEVIKARNGDKRPISSDHMTKHSSKKMTDDLGLHEVASMNSSMQSYPVAPLEQQSGRSVRASSLRALKNSREAEGQLFCRKIDRCAHFHYESVEFDHIQLALVEDNLGNIEKETWLLIRVQSGTTDDRNWTMRRTYETIHQLDVQLHKCIFKRKFSLLPELTADLLQEEGTIRTRSKICTYFERFSNLPVNMINCGPVLMWLEIDNHGNHIIYADGNSEINIPAIGAACSIKRHVARSTDELSMEIGDIISIIAKPPPSECTWWRGKKNFEVGVFPYDCVEMFNCDYIPQSVAERCSSISAAKLGSNKKDWMKTFLFGFFSTRPNRTTLKRSGIFKERLFGCDLGEHLLNNGEDVPQILKSCCEVLEVHGIIDGIYRLSGANSSILKLRNDFDEDRQPLLTGDSYLSDIHSISSLLKMYFRELPNPLLTYQLYDPFIEAISNEDGEKEKISKISEIVKQLPPPHYRTCEYLFRHLHLMASFHLQTSMHSKNLAIVWAPNLLRSKDLEQMRCGAAALRGVGVQAILTEFMIVNVNEIFKEENLSSDDASSFSDVIRQRPNIGLQTPKLLSLEEAQEKRSELAKYKQNYINVGGGPTAIPPKYHTVIDLPNKRGFRDKFPSPSRIRSFFTKSRSTSFKDEVVDIRSSSPQISIVESNRRLSNSCDIVSAIDRDNERLSSKKSGRLFKWKKRASSVDLPPSHVNHILQNDKKNSSFRTRPKHSTYMSSQTPSPNLNNKPPPSPSSISFRTNAIDENLFGKSFDSDQLLRDLTNHNHSSCDIDLRTNNSDFGPQYDVCCQRLLDVQIPAIDAHMTTSVDASCPAAKTIKNSINYRLNPLDNKPITLNCKDKPPSISAINKFKNEDEFKTMEHSANYDSKDFLAWDCPSQDDLLSQITPKLSRVFGKPNEYKVDKIDTNQNIENVVSVIEEQLIINIVEEKINCKNVYNGNTSFVINDAINVQKNNKLESINANLNDIKNTKFEIGNFKNNFDINNEINYNYDNKKSFKNDVSVITIKSQNVICGESQKFEKDKLINNNFPILQNTKTENYFPKESTSIDFKEVGLNNSEKISYINNKNYSINPTYDDKNVLITFSDNKSNSLKDHVKYCYSNPIVNNCSQNVNTTLSNNLVNHPLNNCINNETLSSPTCIKISLKDKVKNQMENINGEYKYKSAIKCNNEFDLKTNSDHNLFEKNSDLRFSIHQYDTPKEECLSAAAMDLFSMDAMYRPHELLDAKLSVNNEDGYVYYSYPPIKNLLFDDNKMINNQYSKLSNPTTDNSNPKTPNISYNSNMTNQANIRKLSTCSDVFMPCEPEIDNVRTKVPRPNSVCEYKFDDYAGRPLMLPVGNAAKFESVDEYYKFENFDKSTNNFKSFNNSNENDKHNFKTHPQLNIASNRKLWSNLGGTPYTVSKPNKVKHRSSASMVVMGVSSSKLFGFGRHKEYLQSNKENDCILPAPNSAPVINNNEIDFSQIKNSSPLPKNIKSSSIELEFNRNQVSNPNDLIQKNIWMPDGKIYDEKSLSSVSKLVSAFEQPKSIQHNTISNIVNTDPSHKADNSKRLFQKGLISKTLSSPVTEESSELKIIGPLLRLDSIPSTKLNFNLNANSNNALNLVNTHKKEALQKNPNNLTDSDKNNFPAEVSSPKFYEINNLNSNSLNIGQRAAIFQSTSLEETPKKYGHQRNYFNSVNESVFENINDLVNNPYKANLYNDGHVANVRERKEQFEYTIKTFQN